MPQTRGGDIPVYEAGREFGLGDTVPGMEIPWVKPDGMEIFVSQKVLLCKVSWNNINACGLLSKPVMIDGKLYRCRLPYIGKNAKDKDEWKAIASTTHRDTDFWGFGQIVFGDKHFMAQIQTKKLQQHVDLDFRHIRLKPG